MSKYDHKMTISLDLTVQFTQFFLICVEQERASFKTTSNYAHLTWRPPVIKK